MTDQKRDEQAAAGDAAVTARGTGPTAAAGDPNEPSINSISNPDQPNTGATTTDAAASPTGVTPVKGGAPKSGDDALKAQITKAAGLKAGQVTAFNPDNRTIVTDRGDKYQLAEDGKTLRTLTGRAPELYE